VLAAAHRREPVMNDGDPHMRRRCLAKLFG
jgi:hypothetical protein